MTNLRLTAAPIVEAAMLVRRPAHEAFEAFADPAITAGFWFTKSTGRLAPGATVTWTWEMYDVSTPVTVTEFEQDKRIVVEWGNGPAITTVEWRFEARGADATFVTVTESGFTGETGDEVAAWALGSMGGFTMVLAGMKALLEHKINLGLVGDRFPDGRPS